MVVSMGAAFFQYAGDKMRRLMKKGWEKKAAYFTAVVVTAEYVWQNLHEPAQSIRCRQIFKLFSHSPRACISVQEAICALTLVL